MNKTYENGECLVTIKSDGTRIIVGNLEKMEFPNSIDLKITDKCLEGCRFCHESSGPTGKEADLDTLKEKLSVLPGYIELALGGGNPLLYSKLPELLEYLKSRKFTINMTIRDTELLRSDLSFIKEYISGLGVSITNKVNPKDYIDYLRSINENYIAHLILGYNNLEEFDNILKYYDKILFLGFKTFGKGKSMKYPEENILRWKSRIKQDLYKGTNIVYSFDNNAINQVDLKSSILDKDWEKYYQGDEFSQSLYIDAVEGYLAKNSITPKEERISWNDLNIIEFYDKGIKERKF